MRTAWTSSPLLLLFMPLIVASDQSSCAYDNPTHSAEFDSCLKIGEKFIKRYTKGVKRGRSGRCSQFSEYQNCVSTILSRCPSMQRSFPPELLLIYQMFNCSCKEGDPASKKCQEDLACFEDQYGGLLARRCNALYKFNMQQATLKKCQLVSENVRCKSSLVTSACGARAGDLAFHVAQMTFKRADRCDIHQDAPYNGFQYTDQCPRDFVDQIQKCEADHFDETKLLFFEENDLVAVGGSRNVQLACRGYRAYKSCIEPLKDKCPSGADMVYEFDSKVRAYLLKMEYICVTGMESYADHVVCYQDILLNQTLKKCNHIYQNLIPVLQRLTAFQFYCQPNHTITSRALEYLDELNTCYGDIFTLGCGVNGSQAMIGLMSNAFRDPYYLHFKFHPNCTFLGLGDPAVPSEPYQQDSTDHKHHRHHNKHKGNHHHGDSKMTSPAPGAASVASKPQPSGGHLRSFISVTAAILIVCGFN